MCQFKFKRVYNELLDYCNEITLNEHKYEIKVSIKVHKKDKTISYLEAFHYAFAYSYHLLKNNINEDAEYIHNVIVQHREIDEMEADLREAKQIYAKIYGYER